MVLLLRLDASQQVRNLLQEHPFHLRRGVPRHVLPLAYDGAAAGHRQAFLLVLQARRIRSPGHGDGYSRKRPWPRLTNRINCKT